MKFNEVRWRNLAKHLLGACKDDGSESTENDSHAAIPPKKANWFIASLQTYAEKIGNN